MSLLTREDIEQAVDLFWLKSPSVRPDQIKDENVAMRFYERFGVKKLWKSKGAKQAHIRTALRKLFPGVVHWSFD